MARCGFWTPNINAQNGDCFSNEDIIPTLAVFTLAGTNQLVFTPSAGKRVLVVAAEISTDTAMNIRLHFGVTPAKPIGGGWMAATGGLVKVFGTAGQVGAVDEVVNVDMSAAGNVDVVFHCIEL